MPYPPRIALLFPRRYANPNRGPQLLSPGRSNVRVPALPGPCTIVYFCQFLSNDSVAPYAVWYVVGAPDSAATVVFRVGFGAPGLGGPRLMVAPLNWLTSAEQTGHAAS